MYSNHSRLRKGRPHPCRAAAGRRRYRPFTLIDTSAEKIAAITENVDALGIVGNGASINVLMEAGVDAGHSDCGDGLG